MPVRNTIAIALSGKIAAVSFSAIAPLQPVEMDDPGMRNYRTGLVDGASEGFV